MSTLYSTSLIPLLNLCLLLMAPLLPAQTSSLGVFDRSLDIGEIAKPGKSDYNPATGEYLLTAPTGPDAFRFLWTTVQGDFILRAEVIFSDSRPSPVVGWAVRDHLGADAPEVRGVSAAEADQHMVLELSRTGDSLSFRSARFGEPLQEQWTRPDSLREEVFAGLLVKGGDGAQVKCRNVRITYPAPASLVPLSLIHI